MSKYIYLSTAHEQKLDKSYIDITAVFTNRAAAEQSAYNRSINGSFKYYGVWKADISFTVDYPELIAVYQKGKSIDINQFDEVL